MTVIHILWLVILDQIVVPVCAENYIRQRRPMRPDRRNPSTRLGLPVRQRLERGKPNQPHPALFLNLNSYHKTNR
jgi:hypothetical protein